MREAYLPFAWPGKRLTGTGLLLLWWLFLQGGQSYGQAVPDFPAQAFRHALKTVPVQPEEINLAYERVTEYRRSWQVGAGYIHQIHLNRGAFVPTPSQGNGLSVRVSRRMYLSDRWAAPEGFYHGPVGVYRFMAFRQTGYLDAVGSQAREQLFQHVLSLQYMFGYQRVLWRWLVLEGYTGAGARLKYAFDRHPTADPSLLVVGHRLASGPNWVLKGGPSLHLNFSLGVTF